MRHLFVSQVKASTRPLCSSKCPRKASADLSLACDRSNFRRSCVNQKSLVLIPVKAQLRRSPVDVASAAVVGDAICGRAVFDVRKTQIVAQVVGQRVRDSRSHASPACRPGLGTRRIRVSGRFLGTEERRYKKPSCRRGRSQYQGLRSIDELCGRSCEDDGAAQLDRSQDSQGRQPARCPEGEQGSDGRAG